MIQASGGYYDGRVSVRRPVVVSVAAGMLEVRGGEVALSFPLAEVRVTPGVGSIRRFIKLPDGGLCDADDPAFLESVLASQGRATGPSLVHRWEKSLAYVALALALTAAIVAAGVRWGVPALAKKVAFAVPVDVEARMGRESLAILDRFVFGPTAIPQARQNKLRRLFGDVARFAKLDGNSRLEFRKGKAIGANALALPNGIVVMTDEMVKLARNDDELASVLAHEAEHVRGRHNMRHILQNSMTALIVAAVTGDIASISSLASTMPTALIDAKYSRDFEREADAAVAAYLGSRKIPLTRYADILGRLQAELDRKMPGDSTPVKNYLSTHPPTGERIRAFRRK